MSKRVLVLLVAAGFASLSTLPGAAGAPPQSKSGKAKAEAPSANPCPMPPPCGNTCSNTPYKPTECWTTQYGPAKADIVSNVSLLYCIGSSGSGSPYALCAFSGPPYPTGTNPSNPSMPCVLQGDVAKCSCEVRIASATKPYFVDINAILNEGAYYQTVTACGPDGSNCANLDNCGPKGDKAGCSSHQQAPVCKYVNQQNPKNPSVSLIPRADMISTFSYAMAESYQQGTTSCASGLYAGCMTAPCFFGRDHQGPPHDGEKIDCECPTWNGPFDIDQNAQKCTITSSKTWKYVWSASYSP